MDFDFDKIFKFPFLAMKMNKSHPAVKRDGKWLIQIIFYHGIFTATFILVIYNIIFHNLKNKDFDETCKNGVLSIVFVVVTYHYCIMVWKQDLLLNIMTLMKKDYEQAKFLPLEEQEIMSKYAKQVNYVCKQWLVISCCGFGMFLLKNIILLTYYLVIGEPKLVPLHDLVYPDILEKNKKNIYVYLALYAHLVFCGVYAMSTYMAFVPLGPSFMLHACGLLEILEKKIESLFDGELDEVEKKLKEIIIKLQYIYNFVEHIQYCFRIAYELTLRGTTILLPITCYEVIEAFHKGDVAMEFITFLVGGILTSSSPCYYSQLLMEKGENVRLAMYMSGWETVYHRGIRSTIRIILLRAQRPIAIRTLFRTVCLETLTDLFQQSYTTFNLMNAMWK